MDTPTEPPESLDTDTDAATATAGMEHGDHSDPADHADHADQERRSEQMTDADVANGEGPMEGPDGA